ncbi:MAG: hypothetical protein QW791_00480 [Candidatus Bathyarchaeia archaeon]
MIDVVLTILCWVSAFVIWQINRYTFKHPTTRLVPKPLRHTWFAGLSVILAIFIFCLPGLLTSFWVLSALFFLALLIKFRDKGLKLLIEDLRMHRRDGRGLFQHSENCYMVGGETATFMKKYLESHQINPFDQN